ncbi:PP2C family protein-serine/threonine phosphatase [Xylophilus sp. ASV27]|uniref:PP2C family protein-serine/threonine phosphatase n=1 Tax=Xylophilus sp. ASV27 TaxID=2795129 RepID=UPI0018EC813A|nr:PP2C family serine/threonine-protein phosphatase [Xylophilus sp. ASV27]
MHYQFHALSDTGRVRQNNEDAVLHDASLGLALLADGIGGYNAGEIASGIAVRTVHAAFGLWRQTRPGKPTVWELRRVLRRCVAQANGAIMEAARSHPGYQGMGTTLVLGVFLDRRMLVGHIGDSRCYRLRGGRLRQLTHDHSVLQEELDAGRIRREDAADAAFRNLVTRALGVDAGIRLELSAHAVEPGDRYLLCSDGLTDMLDDGAIGRLLAAGLPMDGSAEALVRAANAAGGRDNVSVVLVQAEGPPRTPGRIARWLGI